MKRTMLTGGVLAALSLAVACSSSPPPVQTQPQEPPAAVDLRDPSEVHLADLKQLTFAGENAEAYWSTDGTQLIMQTTRPPYECDQIVRMPADGSSAGEGTLVSTGKGRTTCSYFLAGDKQVIYSSTHESGPECPTPPDMSQGYVWGLFDYDIYKANVDGTGLVNLTHTPGYDAEATTCPVDGSIIFTSVRDGDLDLYRMDADGKNVVRLTDTPGYDGGAFFSRDCKQIVWRASRPEGEALKDYKRLLEQNMVRPTQLELYVADADGSNARQVTYLASASFAPYFHPSGKRILFASNYPDPHGREFDIWAVNVDGSHLERITYSKGFDGFPMFSPDGGRIAFSSNRHNAKPHETNVFVARWVDDAQGPITETAADRVLASIAWLADDAREGRGVGTKGLAEAQAWLTEQLRAAGAEGGMKDGGFAQPFDVAVSMEGEATLAIDSKSADRAAPLSFSATGELKGRTVFAGYGVVAPELGVDDYKRVRAKGKVVVVRRFVPEGKPFDNDEAKRRFSDLRYKAFTAREHGAVGMIVIDLPVVAKGAKMPAEAQFPALAPTMGDVGIPVVIVGRDAGARLARGSHRVAATVVLEREMATVANVVGVVRAGAVDKLPGVVVVGAHYDHLGYGGPNSLEPDVHAVHNGADDNASGTAALIEVTRELVAKKDQLRRDVWVVGFSAEESGVLGSSDFVKEPPPGLAVGDVVAMLNMDMVGRMRHNVLTVLGGASGAEWPALVAPACQRAGVRCNIGGSGYGPSDQTPFYAAGVPVLHFFTGAHEDYHKTSDDTDRINAAGAGQAAKIVADVAMQTAGRSEGIKYQKVAAPLPAGDARSFGAALGTIPDYADTSGKPGVLLSGVRPGGPAEKGGLQRGDRIVRIGKTDIREIHDLMYVLQRAKPGQRTTIRVIRNSAPVDLTVTYGTSTRHH